MSNTHFTPAALHRSRHDGWTPEIQTAFIDALSECGIVSAAAQKVGRSASSAYRLRNRPSAKSFARAWDDALEIGFSRLQDTAVDRALNGISVPVFYKGEVVGERRWFDNRLLAFLLRQTNTRRFGAVAPALDIIEQPERDKHRKDMELGAQLAELTEILEGIQGTMDCELSSDNPSHEMCADLEIKINRITERIRELKDALGLYDDEDEGEESCDDEDMKLPSYPMRRLN